MVAKSTFEHTNLADQAAVTADNAIQSTKRVADDTLDSLSNSVEGARAQVSPLINRTTEQAAALAQRGLDAVRNSSAQLRNKAVQASDTTAMYIKNDPIKAVLIAAATGAALMALINLATRSRDR